MATTVAVRSTEAHPSPSLSPADGDGGASARPLPAMKSRLFPADRFREIHSKPSVRALDAAELASALHFATLQPMPDSDKLFPWVHGVSRANVDNFLQHAFFFGSANAAAVHPRPDCFRGIVLVKAGADMGAARLKGTFAPSEILPSNPRQPGFLPSDPNVGFSIRNFAIQVAKFATVSDLVVYGDAYTSYDDTLALAKRLAAAQAHHRKVLVKEQPDAPDIPHYSTFLVQSPFAVFENFFPELVAVDADGTATEHALDFYEMERSEMARMSRASAISHNVSLGCSADVEHEAAESSSPRRYEIVIEACDHAAVPAPEDFAEMRDQMLLGSFPQRVDFPGSNSPAWKNAEPKALLEFCQWVYGQAHGTSTGPDGGAGPQRRVLIYCGDGYTESSLLGLAYSMYAEGLPANEAWLYLHNDMNRNFFAYSSDVRFLQRLQPLLLVHSPRIMRNPQLRLQQREPKWFSKIDGSLPSRILSHLYLGNLDHANNGSMLKALGIKRVLSIGEPVTWSKERQNKWGLTNLCISGVQDNGVDSLISHIERCLKFIKAGRDKGEPTLVHCRVGVSRSATICIAEVMQFLSLSVARAYCYVRARRLNVIIQPHCRFMYELLKWEESQRKYGIKREIEWPSLAREISKLNQPHAYY